MSTEYCPGQVIFIKSAENGGESWKHIPAKIICKCSYGTYKIQAYGNKNDEYVSEHQIEEYSQDLAKRVKEQAGSKNKKMTKFLKNAEKDFLKGAEQSVEIRRMFNIECK